MKTDTDRDGLKANLILIFLAIILCFGVKFCTMARSEKMYNDGIHRGCGGHWIYEGAVGHRFSTNFLYHCDKCGMVYESVEKY